MKRRINSIVIVMFFVVSSTFGQVISETNFSLGVSKTSSSVQQDYWRGSPAPTYLTFNVSKSWYNDARLFSIRKEIGCNLQYANVSLSNGGLGASNHYTGNIVSLFAEASLLARFYIDSTFAVGIGPEAEYLLIGNNNIKNSYYTVFTNPHSSGDSHIGGVNRDYFNQPTFGIKLCFFETGITEKATIGLSVSYLWTKSEYSNFYVSNYTRITLIVGFHRERIKADI